MAISQEIKKHGRWALQISCAAGLFANTWTGADLRALWL